jgi:hypothetical protein
MNVHGVIFHCKLKWQEQSANAIKKIKRILVCCKNDKENTSYHMKLKSFWICSFMRYFIIIMKFGLYFPLTIASNNNCYQSLLMHKDLVTSLTYCWMNCSNTISSQHLTTLTSTRYLYFFSNLSIIQFKILIGSVLSIKL